MRATRAVIYLDHFRHNIQQVRKQVGPNRKICVAVKADAYGHGAIPLSKVALEEGVTHLGVATVPEALELRQARIDAPTLLFSLPLPEEVQDIIENNITPFAVSKDTVKLYEKISQKLDKRDYEIHIKVDTGMGRIGCHPDETLHLAEMINNSPYLKVAGVCTHFPIADEDDESFTLHQVKILQKVVDQLKAHAIDPGLVHAANSGAIIGCEESFFNMVRPGIMLYGYYPSFDQKRHLELKPVMSFMTKVVFMKKVSKGTTISYGRSYSAPEDTIIATLPVGYADGYNRLLSSQGPVFINGKKYQISGRVCMDQCMVDLGPQTDVQLYDDVVLFGAQSGAASAEDIGKIINTIPYEVTCFVSKRVPRVYQDHLSY
ncbi:MAG: alanine racemase [Spirochaetes bacterium]|nr:alanine racemase [Spirochaetota bacterium]